MGTTQYPPVSVSIPQTTAFGEASVSEPTPRVQLQFPYNLNDDLIITASGGTGYVFQQDSKAFIQTGASTNSSGVLRSRDVLRYNTGQGGLARFTTIYTSGIAGSTQIMGVGDDLDGFFFGYNGTQFGVMRRRDGVDDWVYQEDWNIDPMNGSGVSQQRLWHSLGNVYQIRFQWLGYGAITFSIEDADKGVFQDVHRIKYANKHELTSIFNPTLPIFVHANNTSNSSNIVMQTPSIAAFLEGQDPNLGPRHAHTNNRSVGASQTGVFAIRVRDQFGGKRNRVRIQPDYISASNFQSLGTTNDVVVRMILNPSITGTYTNIDINKSVVSYVNNPTFSGGKSIFTINVPQNLSVAQLFKDLDIKLAPNDVLLITGQAITGTSPISVSIAWRELF